ncbi:MAG: hypothetical protein GY769_02110 [bacterium]|nr:hypothetical protein [bacterium]
MLSITKCPVRFLIAFAALAEALGLPAASLAGAETSMTAADVIQRTIEAHGGMEAWHRAPTISYEHTYVNPADPKDPWVSRETIEQGRRRAYLDWPRDNARMAYDGARTWSLNWKRDNPPKFHTHLAYYFLNLPWLTQDPGVRLEGSGTGMIPGDPKEYLTVTMTFAPSTGDTPDDYYVLFIDPETHVMKGTEYIVTYAAMLDLFGLPPEATRVGPFFKVYDEYVTVDGLTVPARYRTLSPTGDSYGDHFVRDVSFREPFDASRLAMPPGAAIDDSDPRHRAAPAP